MENTEQQVKVGLTVLIYNDKGQILLGKRKGSHGENEYATPGGHMEYGESIIDAIKREAFEETELQITNVWFLRVQNILEYFPKHYVDLGFMAVIQPGTNMEPKLMEPDKCEGWAWYNKNELPSPLFACVDTLVAAAEIELSGGFEFIDGKRPEYEA